VSPANWSLSSSLAILGVSLVVHHEREGVVGGGLLVGELTDPHLLETDAVVCHRPILAV
jgi:hypothetical protein